MKMNFNNKKWLSIILYLVSIHSFFVGIGLIFMPGSLMKFFGFEIPVEKFFPVQGGIFHIVMCVIYALAASNIKRNSELIFVTIIAKFMATFFLLIYYIFVDNVWMVLSSAIADCLMGIAILILFVGYRRSKDITS